MICMNLSFPVTMVKKREVIVMSEKAHAFYVMLGRNIAFLRLKKDISQKELADRLKVDSSYVSRIEHANIGISIERLLEIAEALDEPLISLVDFSALEQKK